MDTVIEKATNKLACQITTGKDYDSLWRRQETSYYTRQCFCTETCSTFKFFHTCYIKTTYEDYQYGSGKRSLKGTTYAKL